MTIEEFKANAMGEISADVYHKIEDIYCAYNRFNSKQAIAYFWNENGKDGVDVLMKPLNAYRAMKGETKVVDDKIAKLKAQIAALQEERKGIEAEMKAIELQCDLSWHWADNA